MKVYFNLRNSCLHTLHMIGYDIFYLLDHALYQGTSRHGYHFDCSGPICKFQAGR